MMMKNERIRTLLDRLEEEEGVVVLLAVDAGSRAWGFPSPDSDHDVRFLFCQRSERYLSIVDPRVVIERPITPELDVVGWDIRKALRMMRVANPTILEWLHSPIVYRERTGVAARLRTMTVSAPSCRPLFYHYLHMAQAGCRTIVSGGEVGYKAYLHTLRTVLAMLWMERHRTIPPGDIHTLVDAAGLAHDVRAAIDQVLKGKQGEGGRTARVQVDVLDRTLPAVVDRMARVAHQMPYHEHTVEALDRLFRYAIDVAWATPMASPNDSIADAPGPAVP